MREDPSDGEDQNKAFGQRGIGYTPFEIIIRVSIKIVSV